MFDPCFTAHNLWLTFAVAQPAPVTAPVRKLLDARDGRCCATPAALEHRHAPEPSHIISPSLRSIWQDGSGSERLSAILTAFLTPARAEYLKRTLSATSDSEALHNVLLVSPSIGYAFRNGHISLRPSPSFAWAKAGEKEMSKTSKSSEVRNARSANKPLLTQPVPAHNDIAR